MLKRADVNYVYDWFLSRDSLLSFHFEVRSIRSSINTSFLPNLLNKHFKAIQLINTTKPYNNSRHPWIAHGQPF